MSDARISTVPARGDEAPGRAAGVSGRVLVIGAVALLAVSTGVGVIASSAKLSNTKSSTAAGVTAATVSVGVSGGASSTAWITASSAGVGTGGATYQGLTVTNTGTAALRYAMTATSSNSLSPLIAAEVASISGTTCNATTFASGTLISTAGATIGTGSATAKAVIGNKTTGADTGDQSLAASATQNLCLRVYVRTGSGRAAQAASGITSAFTFYSEQTAHNPQSGAPTR